MASIVESEERSSIGLEEKINYYCDIIAKLYSEINYHPKNRMCNLLELVNAQKRLILNFTEEIQNVPADIKEYYQVHFEILNDTWNEQLQAIECSSIIKSQIENENSLTQVLEEIQNSITSKQNSSNKIQEKELRKEFLRHKEDLEYLMTNFCSEDMELLLRGLIASAQDKEGDGYMQLNSSINPNLLYKLLDEKLIVMHPHNKLKIRIADSL